MSVADAVCHHLQDPDLDLHEVQSHEEEEEGEDEEDKELANEEEEDAEEENSAESEALHLIFNFFLSNSQSTSCALMEAIVKLLWQQLGICISRGKA